MNIALAYICVSNGGQKTHDYAARFVGSYLQFKPGIEHQTFIVCNGGLPPDETQMLFLPMPNCVLYPRLNDKGWDISAYQDVARTVKCDLLLCFGESVYFHREGWGLKLVEAAEKYGKGMYGVYASNLVRGHLNTTAFACSPEFLINYPQVKAQIVFLNNRRVSFAMFDDQNHALIKRGIDWGRSLPTSLRLEKLPAPRWNLMSAYVYHRFCF